MPLSPKVGKIFIDLQPRVLGTLGYANLEKSMGGVLKGGKAMVDQAKLIADAAEREAQRTAVAWERSQERVTRAAYRTQQAQLKYNDAVYKSGEMAARKYKLAWDEAYRQQEAASKTASEAAIANQRAQAAASVASSRAGSTARTAAVAGAFGRAGTVVGGAGVIGVGAGYELVKQGIKWQSFISQTQANAGVSNAEVRSFQNIAFRIAKQTGANPQDIVTALRYGAEMGLPLKLDERYLQTAIHLGLPTGGSAALPPAMLALATVRKNFPQYANSPNKIGNVILSASQSAPGVSAPDFIAAIPKLLNIAGHIGGPNQFNQSVSIVAALRSAGMPLDEAQTQATNLITKVFKPTPGTMKYITQLRKATGIDLSGDFGPQALRKKGLLGVINDLASHNLGPTTLGYLFPNMRGYFGALGLTGNQNNSFNNIYQKTLTSQQRNPLGTNFNRYLGLDSTQAEKLKQQLHVLTITVGTELLPPVNTLLKDDVLPLAKAFADWSEKNRGTIATLITMAPYLIAVGGGLKLVSGGMNLILKYRTASTVLSDTAKAGSLLTAVKWAGAATGIGAVALAFGKLALNLPQATDAINKFFTKQFHANKGDLFPFGQHAASAGTLLLEAFGGPGLYAANKAASALGITHSGASKPSGKQGASLGQSAALPYSQFGLSKGAGGQFTFNKVSATTAGIWVGNAKTGHWVPWGQDPSAFHWDYGDAGQVQEFSLPGTGRNAYRVVGVRRDQEFPNTRDLTVRDPSGGLSTIMHVHLNPGIGVGSTVYGRQGLGVTDKGAAHLHIGGDARALAWFHKVAPNGWMGNSAVGTTTNKYKASGSGGVDWSKVPHAVAQYRGFIVKAAQMTGVSAARIAAVIWTESRGHAGAKGPNVVSADGSVHNAYGLMQIMDFNFPSLGLTWSTWQNPWLNIYAGARILRGDLSAAGGNLHSALNSYSGGGADIQYAGTGKTYYQYTAGNASAWAAGGSSGSGGTGSGKGGKQVNYTPPSGSAKTGPHTAYQWSEWWGSKASNLSGKIGQFGDIFSAKYGAGWGPHKLTPGEWSATVALLGPYYKDEYQSARSLAMSEFKNNPAQRKAAISAAWTVYQRELRHPFKYGPFAHTSPASGMDGWGAVHVAGNNRQLAAAEQSEKHLRKLVYLEQQKIKRLEAENRRLRGQHGKTANTHHTNVGAQRISVGSGPRFRS